MRRVCSAALAAALLCATAASAAAPPAAHPALAAALAAEAQPMAVFVASPDRQASYGAATGAADLDAQRPLTVETPLRIASNTKTFVAATVLRLWEQGRIDLDAPIGPLLTPALNRLLREDGYRTDRITVRHLLSHSAGLYDHGGDPRFTAAIFADPEHRWTREELVRLSTSYADPQSAPGTEFRYSDTGYILLGDIVERIIGQPIAAAVRDQLRLDQLNLSNTWWEVMEAPPARSEARARQWLGEREATGIHASMDLYGGGGLVMSARDLATFTQALFSGRLFDRPETLREMLKSGSHRGGDQYRLGIFVKQANGREYYWHSGFWGTIVYYDPQRRTAVAGVTTNQDGFGDLKGIVERTIGAM